MFSRLRRCPEALSERLVRLDVNPALRTHIRLFVHLSSKRWALRTFATKTHDFLRFHGKFTAFAVRLSAVVNVLDYTIRQVAQSHHLQTNRRMTLCVRV
mgnify:CR=1 FL=1